MNDIIRDCLKHEDQYEGCKLCFGKGTITAWSHSVSLNLVVDKKEIDRCPRCEGNGIVRTVCDRCEGKGFTVEKFENHVIEQTRYDQKPVGLVKPEQIMCQCGKCYGKGKIKQ